ncbi:MAG: DUF3887 domain-containing protein [Oscillospiraceae bacterium]|nr:DUF3887 domain-containing protein [Oscillospiraceae bacterium]
MKKTANALFCLLLLLALTACKGKPLPDGMDETSLLERGQEVLLLIAGGEYEAVYDALRDDVAAGTSVEDIQALALRQLDGAGVYKQIESRMTTGQSSGGESYGIAVMYCQFSEDDVLVRLAFDPNLDLIGLEIKKQ